MFLPLLILCDGASISCCIDRSWPRKTHGSCSQTLSLLRPAKVSLSWEFIVGLNSCRRNTLPYYSGPYHTIPFWAIPYHTILGHTIPCHTHAPIESIVAVLFEDVIYGLDSEEGTLLWKSTLPHSYVMPIRRSFIGSFIISNI